jgi:hypothetical protein
VTGNLIGTDSSGVLPLSNENGIVLHGRDSLVKWNTIAFNGSAGVVLPAGAPNGILTNSIHSNGELGIDVNGDGVTPRDPADAITDAPLIHATRIDATGATVVDFTIPATGDRPSPLYVVEWYAGAFADGSGHGEGKQLVHAAQERLLAAGEHTITIPANLAGRFLAATATPWDTWLWYPGANTSEFSEAVQVQSDGCRNSAPLLIGPDGAQISNLSFRWSAVPGATSYRVWLMKRFDLPRMLDQRDFTTTEVTTSLAPGRYEWWVEANFDGCYGTQSAHRTIYVQ